TARPLPDHVARVVPTPRAASPHPFRPVASAESPSTGVAEQRPRGGDGTEKQASSAVAPTDRVVTTAVPGGSCGGPPARGEGLPHSEQPPERAVVERAIDA
ncbi:unnamed protein product, partial [Laminaria digitata]